MGRGNGHKHAPAEGQPGVPHPVEEALLDLLAERRVVAEQAVVVVDRPRGEGVHGRILYAVLGGDAGALLPAVSPWRRVYLGWHRSC